MGLITHLTGYFKLAQPARKYLGDLVISNHLHTNRHRSSKPHPHLLKYLIIADVPPLRGHLQHVFPFRHYFLLVFEVEDFFDGVVPDSLAGALAVPVLGEGVGRVYGG